jgi:hypothetical protein
MLNRALYVASALSVALALVWSVGAQPPGQTPDKTGAPPRSIDDRSGPRGGFRAGPGRRGGPDGGFRQGGTLERILDDLNLSGQKKDQAEAAVKEYQENVRKLMGLARSDLLLKMKEVLSEEEFKKFSETLDRPPGLVAGRGRRGAGFFGIRGLTVDQIVERIMSFDKNKDGKITKDELPERMQDLIARGDTNKDGALDTAEIKKLATDLARNGSFRRFDDRGGPDARFRPGPGVGFPAGGGIERVLEDLKLSDKKKDTAETAVKAHLDNVRKLMDLARADLLLKMKDALSEEEFKTFKVALDRRPAFGVRFNGRDGPFPTQARPAGASRSGDLERRLDQLQQDLDSLRREIRR